MLRRASLAILFVVLVPHTVQAFDHHEHHHSSDGGDGCSGSSTSSVSATPTTVSPTPSAPTAIGKRVFVTSATFTGSLGGAKGGDAECQTRALTSGVPGTFRAWLSDGSTGAYDRTADVGPWYTTGDALAFSSKSDLRSAPQSELLDEYGGHADGAGAWSGNDTNGAASGHDCEGWRSAANDAIGTAGTAIGLDPTWGGGTALRSCALAAPLVCFEQ